MRDKRGRRVSRASGTFKTPRETGRLLASRSELTGGRTMVDKVSLEESLKLEALDTEDAPPFTFDKTDRQIVEDLVGDEHIATLERAISVVREVQSKKSSQPKHSVVQSTLKFLVKSLSGSTKWLTDPSSNFDRYLLHEVKTRYRGSADELQIVTKGLPKLIEAMQRASNSSPFLNELFAKVNNEDVPPNKGGRPENKTKKLFAWRVVEIFAKTGQTPTKYRDGPLSKLLEICFKYSGFNDADPYNSLTDKQKWEEMKRLSKVFRPSK